MIPEHEEALKMVAKYAREAGFYKGLLEGLMIQTRDMGDYYEINSEYFDKVQKAYDNWKS